MKTKFTSAKELEVKINEFWNYCNDNNLRVTVTRFAWFIGTNRATLSNYIRNRDFDDRYIKELSLDEKENIILLLIDTLSRIESEYEDRLYSKESCVGSIFSLKNNYNWVDKQEISQTHNVANPLESLNDEELKKIILSAENEGKKGPKNNA